MNFWNRSHSNLQTTKEIWDEKDGRVCLVQHFTALPTLFLTEKKRTLHNMTIFTNTYISNLVSGLFTADIKLHKLTQLLSRTLHVHFIKTKDKEFTTKWIRWDNRCRVFFFKLRVAWHLRQYLWSLSARPGSGSVPAQSSRSIKF